MGKPVFVQFAEGRERNDIEKSRRKIRGDPAGKDAESTRFSFRTKTWGNCIFRPGKRRTADRMAWRSQFPAHLRTETTGNEKGEQR